MKLNRRHIRKLILKEMSGMGDGGSGKPPEYIHDDPLRDMGFPDRQESQAQLPPHLDIEDAYEGESDIIDVMPLISAMAAEIEGSHGGLGSEEAAYELIRRIDMSHPDTDGIDGVAESLAMAALDLMLRNRSAGRR